METRAITLGSNITIIFIKNAHLKLGSRIIQNHDLHRLYFLKYKKKNLKHVPQVLCYVSLVSQKVHYLNNPRKMYRENTNMTYLRLILGLVRNANFHSLYHWKYSEQKLEILAKFTCYITWSFKKCHNLKYLWKLKKKYHENINMTNLN